MILFISKLKINANSAYTIKKKFEDATQKDNELTQISGSITYTNRLIIAMETYELESKLTSYNNVIVNLPVLDCILYPDISYLGNLTSWLKNNSMYQTQLNMTLKKVDGNVI